MSTENQASLLRIATAGSVDDGKSTLVGRLLHDTKNILVDQLEAIERVSESRGLSSADLALLTDGLRAEREQGITRSTWPTATSRPPRAASSWPTAPGTCSTPATPLSLIHI